ncbi:MAG: response regulator [Lachnospiraceae bacterium]|nr:response regulator [Lachnospiraceae bacterium]
MSDKETILIVDDWDVNIELLEAILESLGYNTCSAMSAASATEIINNNRPHLILLDIMMPDISGYEFCEMLKENPRTRDIPVIFVSAAESDEEREKAFEIGGVDFIRKPFDTTEIKTRVSTHLNIYNLRRELEDNNRKLNKVISEQSRKILEEKKRILKNIAAFSSDENNSAIDNEAVAKNSRMLAQALNFSDRYENKISESFVEAVEIGALIRGIDIKIFEVFFTEDDNDESVKTVADIVYGFHEVGTDVPLPAMIVKITDAFSRLSLQYNDREKALSALKEQDGLDPYILDMFFRIEKQMR